MDTASSSPCPSVSLSFSPHPPSDPTNASADGVNMSPNGAGSREAAPSSAVVAWYWYFLERRMRTSLSRRLARSCEFSNWRRRRASLTTAALVADRRNRLTAASGCSSLPMAT